MSSATSPGLPAGVQVNFHMAPLVFLTGTSCRLTRWYPGNFFSAKLSRSMALAAASMSVVFCGVRSTSTSRSPGPVNSVARWSRFSLQPGGRSSEKPATAGEPRSVAVTVACHQPDGITADGWFSASTDLKPVGVSATNALPVDCVPFGEPPPLWWFSASAAPTPTAAAMMTATTSQAICRPRPRPRPERPPPAPGAYCLARSGYDCDGPAYCSAAGGNGEVPPPGWPCPVPLEPPYAGRRSGVGAGGWGRAGLAELAAE